ncbi:MAG: D-alanyl-D-alanine carboxypeptidase [Oscillatoriales cyanobacterium SM2_1_8]|nr:D-alanyl-D-alanine carboxypeptidase [Oscillatoriales cyanobacterium SM2_1_8]
MWEWVLWMAVAMGDRLATLPAAGREVGTRLQAERLAALRQAGYGAARQGLWLQSAEGLVLAEHQGTVPLPAASLTKLATSLVALHQWREDHRFVTTVAAGGPIANGVLQGDLLVQGGGDPLFVWEDAIALGHALHQLGIRRVAGNLVVTGNFWMNFTTDRTEAATRLRQGLHANLWPPEASAQYAQMAAPPPRPQVAIAGQVLAPATASALTLSSQTLLRYESLPLWQILHRLNIYSNNFMADALAAQLGGAAQLQRRAMGLAGIPAGELQLVNGSGLGVQNRMSPRAAVALTVALDRLARQQGLTLADLLPEGRCRCGTIEHRDLPGGAFVKTGTLNEVSALAGVVQTRERGPLWFALLEGGAGSIETFHGGQDRFLRGLTAAWGEGRAAHLSGWLAPAFAPRPWRDEPRARFTTVR